MASPALLSDLPKGHEFPAIVLQITSEGARAYLAAVADANSVYQDHGLAPPLAVAARALRALPDLTAVRKDADVVFTWNGTTSGARVPDADWIAADPARLPTCDAPSAVFAQGLDAAQLRGVTFSWQQGLGGQGEEDLAAFRLSSNPGGGVDRLTEEVSLFLDNLAGVQADADQHLLVERLTTVVLLQRPLDADGAGHGPPS